MSGFGSGGFSGFGQNNNNNQQSSFGGFGSTNTNTNTSFGAANTNTATSFGSNTNTGGGLFGNNSGGGGGFGASASGFGATSNNNTFGAKPAGAFGAAAPSSGTGLFGSGNTTTPAAGSFGGFGSNAASSGTTSGFGATSGGMFGGGGATNTNTNTGGSLFGGGNTSNTTSFGGGGFGATNNPGIGGNASDPPGTNSTPFQAHQEKETTGAGNQSNSFQNILFQDPYKKWSAEELRLTDYNQGRRYGNASGTGAFGVSNFGSTGAFGATNNNTTQQSTGFGATPSTGSNLFGGGASNTTGSAFGGGSTGGFGSTNTGGGLFGAQSKPAATGGLFGGGTTQPAASGGLFGNSGTTGGGFGANTNTTTGGFGASTANTGGGGLFGSTANTTQAKPGGFSFGNTNTATTSTGFGAASTGGGFGSNTTNTAGGGGLFGGGNTGTTGGGLFGGGNTTQQQQNTGTGFGGGTGFGAQTQQAGGGLFGGNNQQKPAGGGLFGGGAAATTGGGLFGNTASNTTSGFGASNNAAAGGGLFGGQKPATGGTGLFGSAQPAQNTAAAGGGGLFGGLGSNTQNQQTGQGGLFGGGAQNQAKPSMFGASQSTGGGLFGSQGGQQQQSMFSNSNNQQQQQGSLLGGSLLGNMQNNNAPAQQSLTASISDLSAYGTPALFSNLNGNESANPGPLATPLSSKTKTRRSSILPMYKLNPASSTRFVTPQKRGFGFSYSTYGSPSGSPSSVTSTPGSMNRSLLGNSLSRGLTKSVSSSSLRKSFSAEDSILAPGAFSASSGPRYYGNTGSVRKLVINKDMRSDLFATPTKEKPSADQVNGSRKLSKRVSFDTSTMDASEDGEQDVVTPRNAPSTSNDLDSRVTNGAKPIAAASSADADSSKGKELAIVHEEDAFAQTPQASSDGSDKAPGTYWMSPKQDVIASMNRMQRQKVANFTVGRDNVGYVSFKVPVDLSSIDLDEIFAGIVVLDTRSATVYPNSSKKPPVGKGLNVPAIISLDQSWPRGRDKRPTLDQKRLNKHIERLKKIPDTTFVDYNSDTGVWKFSVEHFTTYGLDYDEDETDADLVTSEQPQQRSAPAPAPAPAAQSSPSEDQISPADDDTFDFRRKCRALPGAFDHREGDLEDDDDVLASTNNQNQPFFGHSSAGSTSKALILLPEDDMAIDQDDEYDMYENEDGTGPSLEQHLAAEQQSDSSDDPGSPIIETPGGILRARMRAIKGSATPLRLQVADGDAWMDMLQKSVSPQKRDRALLKSDAESGARPNGENDFSGTTSRVVSDGRGFATSIDLMNSLFEKAKAPVAKAPPPSMGFVQWPYERQRKTFGDQSDLSENDLAYHKSVKPGWGPDGTLIFPSAPSSLSRTMKPTKADILSLRARVPQGAETGVCLMKFSNESSAKAIENQMRMTSVAVVDGVPTVSLNAASLKSIFHHQDLSNPASAHERLVWDLASILFDRVVPSGTSTEEQLRKGSLSRFWTDLVDASTSRAVALAKTNEEKALTSLAGHRVQEACKLLIEGKDFRLATLVSLIGTSSQSKRDMRAQLIEWQDNNVLSDFADAIRAIYEVLGGNVCVCEGKKGVPVADRMESFVIARRFGLDWKQSFGLRLWYAISQEQNISTAVKKFVDDVTQDREDTPLPWYIEQGFDALWEDQDRNEREDLLWGLLQLYADDATDLESILRPENSQLSPLDSRLTWQLGRALPATGKVSFGVDASEKADAATLSFADQLVNEGNWVEATFVLLHLSNPKTRAKAVQEHLSRHAGLIGSETSADFNTLTQTLKIPSAWVWEARALYMRSVKADPVGEVKCLLQAESYEAAHRVLVDKVAPSAIIERDYAGLATLLSAFEGHEEAVSGWGLGGDIYNSFLTLHRHFGRRERVPSNVVEKLLSGLPVIRETAESGDMISQAAVSEMSSIVAKVVMDATEHDQSGVSRILGLPLTEDAHLQHSLHLSRTYYRGIMAGAR
ncbi:hypothetical protein ACHAQA_009606 [Verticillium albo-atrum]